MNVWMYTVTTVCKQHRPTRGEPRRAVACRDASVPIALTVTSLFQSMLRMSFPQDLAKKNARDRVKAYNWSLTKPLARLVRMRMLYETPRLLFEDKLWVGSKRWEVYQCGLVAIALRNGASPIGARKYRIYVLYVIAQAGRIRVFTQPCHRSASVIAR